MQDDQELVRAQKLAAYEYDLRCKEIQYRRVFEWRSESFNAVITYSKTAITALLALNGLAAINLLHFAGKALEIEVAWRFQTAMNSVETALLGFVCGLILAVGCATGSYISQAYFTHDNLDDSTIKERKRGTAFQVVAFVLGSGSLAGFVFGCYGSLEAIRNLADFSLL